MLYWRQCYIKRGSSALWLQLDKRFHTRNDKSWDTRNLHAATSKDTSRAQAADGTANNKGRR